MNIKKIVSSEEVILLRSGEVMVLIGSWRESYQMKIIFKKKKAEETNMYKPSCLKNFKKVWAWCVSEEESFIKTYEGLQKQQTHIIS